MGGLLTGSQIPANYNKRCVKGDGKAIDVNVQITCVWSGGAPHFLICYVRPRNALPSALPDLKTPQSRIHVFASDESEVSISSGGSSPCGQGTSQSATTQGYSGGDGPMAASGLFGGMFL